MRANNKKPYFPKESKTISDINRAWERLEKAEHERELALREELIRQEKLEQLAARFNQAASKKHEAIETDIFAYEERVQAVVAVASELESENYHDIDRINARRDNVLRLWNYLLELIYARRNRLVEELKMRLLSDDYGRHLIGVEDLLQKHSLVEADINVLGERVKQVVQQTQGFVEEETPDGYKPCDPSIIIERVQALEDAYSELVRIAVERRSRLEESKLLWQFYWDMAEEENWIKEMENILSQGDIGHDLTTINLLLSKHKSIETEIHSHETALQSSLEAGNNLMERGHFGEDKIRERSKRLTEAVDFHQFLTDADDVDTWMLDILRLVSSDDTGKDESNVQTLLKKQKEITDELKSYQSTIDTLHSQASQLGETDRDGPAVKERLESIDNRYKELQELARLRKQRLLDALSLYKLCTEADGVEQWITEKEKMLVTMTPGKDIEDCEIMKHRFDGFEREMNANASRVAVVNQLARQLLHVDHPNSEDITDRQNQLNSRWADLREKAEQKREELGSAHGVQTYHIECRETVTWIEDKKRVLEQTDELKMDLTGIMTLQRKLSEEAEKIKEIHPEEAEVVRERNAKLRNVWEELNQMLKVRDAKLEEAGDLHRFLKDLDHFQSWLTKTESSIANEDTPSSLAEAEKTIDSTSTNS
ncbi:SPTB [Lepeophtheirus salmonis]|uniref:SPTB n=1 Tax=Lepeophtheirus salmonis TaxID=72036 RepID=A0A7R8H9L9_LEPSM|nr:SPTB [Lepeophtheirus salmonis]CAF2943379.1 SPTB [Lepeophtheirus salmonis]